MGLLGAAGAVATGSLAREDSQGKSCAQGAQGKGGEKGGGTLGC